MRKPNKKTVTGVLTAFICVCCASILGYFGWWLAGTEKTAEVNLNDTLTVLNVGQAKCTVIKSDGHYAMIDAGQDSDGEDIVSYLEDKKVKKIDLLVLTHFHTDHTSAVKAITENFDVETILIPDLSEENTPATAFFEMLIEMAEDGEINIETAEKGAEYTIGNGVIKVLSDTVNLSREDTSDDDRRINDTSVCLSFTQGDFVFVDTGDAQSDVEEAILKDIPKNITVFNASHHGARDSNSEEFVRKLSPDYVTISCGKDNSYGHPSAQVTDMLDRHGIDYIITWQYGNIVFSIDDNMLAGGQ